MAHHARPSKPLFARSMGVATSLAATTAWGANYAPFIVPAGIAGSWGARDYHQYAARIGVKYTW
jgi:hypothetical protein